MEDPVDHVSIKAGINEELKEYYQKLVHCYRPDLRDEQPPLEPLFPCLQPYHVNEQREIDDREVKVTDLLTTQLQEGVKEMPRQLLLVGRPESGKTALFALFLHYWLHDKTKIKGLSEIEILLAVQCLGLEVSAEEQEVDLKKHMLAYLPRCVETYGEAVVLQVIQAAKVLFIIDSSDCVLGRGLTKEEYAILAPSDHHRVVTFSQLKYVKDNHSNPLHNQSKENLVLKLWGGVTANPFSPPPFSAESISDLTGGFSGQMLKDYCIRLCMLKNMNSTDFFKYYNEMLRHFPVDMRKPFNIYIAVEAYSRKLKFDEISLLSELYSKWIHIQSFNYKKQHHNSSASTDYDNLIMKGNLHLSKLAYDTFIENHQCLPGEDGLEDPGLVPYLCHFLVPHYNASKKVQRFTFRIAVHGSFLAAKHIVQLINNNLFPLETIMKLENYYKFIPMFPMVLGLAQGSGHYDGLKGHAIKLARLILCDQVTAHFHDPIINYAVTLLSETKLFSKTDGQYDPFVSELVESLADNNWTIVDGNIHHEALKVLCDCGHDEKNGKPQRMNIILSGLPCDMPGLVNILETVRSWNIRISLSSHSSFLSKGGTQPLDAALKAIQGRGKASVGSFMGYLADVKKLDKHPATRRLNKISLRILEQEQYNSLHTMAKNSNKLERVTIRISVPSAIIPKKLKEMPPSISYLTVFLEGVTDEDVGEAIAIWRAIQGSVYRKEMHLRFWDIKERRVTPSGVLQLIEANFPATKVDVSLKQPLNEYDEERIKSKLQETSVQFIVKLMGSVEHPRRDLTKQK